MEGFRRPIFQKLHTLTKSHNNSPSNTLKKTILEIEKDRKRKNPKRNSLFVETPESLSWLDTASMPMFATVVRIALFAKLLMMVLFHCCYHILAVGLNGYMATIINLKSPSNKWRCGAAPITAMMTVKHYGRGSGSGATTLGKPVVHPVAVDLRGKVYKYVKFPFV